MAKPRVAQPSGQPPGISDGHSMHGAGDGSIRAHGQRADGNRSREGPGKPCSGKSALGHVSLIERCDSKTAGTIPENLRCWF